MSGPFKMKSGNSPLFKRMGGSPMKDTKKKQWYVENYEAKKDEPGFKEAMNKAFESDKKGKVKVDGKTTTQKYTT